MAEFEHGEVQFERGFRALFWKNVCDKVFNQLSATMQQLFLYYGIFLFLRGGTITRDNSFCMAYASIMSMVVRSALSL